MVLLEESTNSKVVRRKSNALTINAQVGSYCIKVDKLGNSSPKHLLFLQRFFFSNGKTNYNNGRFNGTRDIG